MKGRSMRLALPAAVLALVVSAPGRAEEAVKALLFTASPSGQDRILQNVPRGVGARFSRIYSHPTSSLDNKRSTSRTSYGPLSSAGGKINICTT